MFIDGHSRRQFGSTHSRSWSTLAVLLTVASVSADAPRERGSDTAIDLVSAATAPTAQPIRGEVILPWDATRAIRDAVDAGEIPDPRLATQTHERPSSTGVVAGPPPCLTSAHVFPYEDSDSLLLTNFTIGSLLVLMGDAANAVFDQYGDNFDFVGYWINFVPHHQIGGAFYSGMFNDVSGLGLPEFNNRDLWGVVSDRLQGVVMMWNVVPPTWQPGTGVEAIGARLVLAQEFEHRFAMFLPPLTDGRVLQGDDATCGRSAHWSFRVDGQGSGMEIAEWIGQSPAYRLQTALLPSGDIGGNMFSYTDLYLMGYVSPEEMDAGNTELRFMDNSACGSPYTGNISTFTSADIIASAGPRIPNAADSQKHYKTAWVMIHLPGQPPTPEQLAKAARIQEQHTRDWFVSTLGRGTMDNSLFTDCNCNSIPDADEPGGATGIGCNVSPDVDDDGDVDLADFSVFADCSTTPVPTELSSECTALDFDSDADVDLTDFRIEHLAFTGDCESIITEQPADVAVCPGESAAFSVNIDGGDAEAIWHHNGVFLPDSFGSTFEIENVQASDAGVYGAIIFASCTYPHSAAGRLTVFTEPEIVTPPLDTNVCEGESATLTVEVTGHEPIAYQWWFNGAEIPGATADTIVIDAVHPDNVGQYQCAIQDGCDSVVLTKPADLLIPNVEITAQPAGGAFCVGDSVFLFAAAANATAFQWYKDGDPIPGQTTSFLAIPNVQLADAGAYHLVATGQCESATTNAAIITVSDCP